MTITTRLCLLAAAVAASPTFAQSEVDTRIDELTDLVGELRTEIAELRGDDSVWLTETRTEEIRMLVQDVLADADTRASLMQGVSGGYDKGFVIGNADFSLKLNGQVQFRYAFNHQDMSPSGDDDVSGFEVRRAKLKFSGHVFSKDWKYNVVGAFLRTGGTFRLEDAVITYGGLENGAKIVFGQYKAPVLREELVSSSRQLAVERSLVNEAFNQGYSQGVGYAQETDQMRYAVMYHDGLRRPDVGALIETTDWGGVAARVEFLGSGTWGQFKSMTGFPGGEQGLLVGAAVNYERKTLGPTDVDDLLLTADVSMQWDGASAMAYFVYNSLDADGSADTDPWGVVVQGGMFFSDHLEGFARYEYADADSSGVEDLSLFTIGVNRYWEKHQLKWTTDIGYGFNAVASMWSNSGADWRTDAANEDGQLVIRSQFQLVF